MAILPLAVIRHFKMDGLMCKLTRIATRASLNITDGSSEWSSTSIWRPRSFGLMNGHSGLPCFLSANSQGALAHGPALRECGLMVHTAPHSSPRPSLSHPQPYLRQRPDHLLLRAMRNPDATKRPPGAMAATISGAKYWSGSAVRLAGTRS